MRIFALHQDPYNWHPATTYFQYAMFHGEAILPHGRCGEASHLPEELPCEPMQLVVNAHLMPEVFCPERSCNLVVSEPVMRSLEPHRMNFLFLPVAFQKVFRLPWSPDGEDVLPPRYEAYRQAGRERSILAACPHDPQAAAELPPYFELVAPNHYPLLDRHPPAQRVFTKWYTGEPVESDLLPVSRSLFEEYPVTCPGYTLVREDVFAALSPHLDRRFFGIKEFSVGPE